MRTAQIFATKGLKKQVVASNVTLQGRTRKGQPCSETAVLAVKSSEETGQQAIAAATAGIDVLHKVLRRGTAHYNSGDVDTFLVAI